MLIFLIGLISIVAFIVGAILISIFAKTVLWRIGSRNIKRRVGNTILVIIGSLVGSALISGSLILYDSLDKTFYSLVDRMAGEMDATVELQDKKLIEGGSVLTQVDYEKVKQRLAIKEIDGVMPVFYFQASPVKLDKNGKPEINTFNIEVTGIDFNTIKDFGQDPQSYIKAVKNNEIVIAKTLASQLEAKEGDTILLTYGDTQIKTIVKKIYKDSGIIGGNKIIIDNNYLSKELSYTEPVYNMVLVSAKGGIKPNNYDGDRFEKTVNKQLEGFESENYSLKVKEWKEDALDGYGMKSFVWVFLGFSCFGIFAGILLIMNLYSMLAEERKMEMGIMRAIAFTRGDLIRSFIYEGFIYTLISSLLGSLLGTGIGWALIRVLQKLFSEGFEFGAWMEFKFAFTLRSLVIAFCIGFIITIITVLIASYKNSKLNIVAAIRSSDEEEKRKIGAWWVIRLVAKIMILMQSIGSFAFSFVVKTMMESARDNDKSGSLSSLSDKQFDEQILMMRANMIYFGVVISVFMISSIINQIFRKTQKRDVSKYTTPIACLINILFTAFMGQIGVIKDSLKSDNIGIAGIFVVSGIILVVSLSLLIVRYLKFIYIPIGWVVNRIGWLKSVFKFSFRYPDTNRAHTSRTLIMFAIVIYILTFLTLEQTLANKVMKKEIKKALGGYDLIVQPSYESDIDLVIDLKDKINKVKGIEKTDIAMQTLVSMPDFKYKDLKDAPFYGNPDLIPDHSEEDAFKTFYNVVTDDFLRGSTIKLAERSKVYKTDAEAWEAVINDNNKVVLGLSFSSQGFGKQPKVKLGDKIKIADMFGQNIQEKEVIGLVSSESGGGVGIGMTNYIITTDKQIIKQFIDKYINQFSSKTLLGKYEKNAKASTVTKDVKKTLITNNILLIMSLEEMVAMNSIFLDGFMAMFKGFLSFSLIVGISGVAIIITRAVHERRQQIGMLRSLGFQRSMILLMFLVESTLITFLAIIIGASMGYVSGYTIFETVMNMEMPFPYLSLGGLFLLVYAVSIMFSVLPSIKAAKMKPVEATNYPE